MKKLPMRRIVSLPVLAAFVVLGASCSQQVQQPVKKAVPPLRQKEPTRRNNLLSDRFFFYIILQE